MKKTNWIVGLLGVRNALLILGGIGLQKSNKQKTNGTGGQTMTDRERLMELISKVQYLGGLEEKVADHLLANGVIVPPCKVGDKVYVPVEGTPCVFETKVLAIGVDEDGDFVLNPYEYPDDVFCVSGVNIGKTVFFTKEEAEAKLKELGNNA